MVARPGGRCSTRGGVLARMTTARLSPSAVLRALQEESQKIAPPTLGAPTPPLNPEGILAGEVQGSWGWSFLIAMGFLVAVYCAVGCCRASTHGRSGLAAMPHADFWRSLPQLVGDGVRFAMGEDIPDPRERSVAGIAGNDDEYYADRPDSAEYIPIAGGSVSRTTLVGVRLLYAEAMYTLTLTRAWDVTATYAR